MKKIILLFTILCAGALSGMETKRSFWDDLPRDIRYEIINKALKTSNSLDGAIAALKNLSVVQGVEFDKLFSDQKIFTAVVHILADKFNSTTEDIAKKFGTPAAKTYLQLAEQLKIAISSDNVNKVAALIDGGVDVNYNFETSFYDTGATLLTHALAYGNVEIIQLLLDSGANPNLKDKYGKTALEWAQEFANDEEIKQMLNAAVKKQQK